MLEEITVRDFALIDNISLQFSPGFNILTGETGAGKSLLIGAISFLLGAKSDAALIREGADECVVTGSFDIAGTPPATDWLAERGIEADESRIVIRRAYKSGGRGFIYIQGQAVSRSDLLSLTALLVDIHGQHEHQNLLLTENHRILLDRFAGIEEKLDSYAQTYRQLHSLREEREKAEAEMRQRHLEADFLRFQVQEITAAKLKSDEKEELETEENVLTQHEKLFASVEMAYAGLSFSGDGAASSLRKAKTALETASSIDPRLMDQAKRLADAFYEVDDLADSIRSYRDSLSFDPLRLEWIETRLAEIHRLEKKYAASVPEILERAENNKTKLIASENWEEDRAKMDAQIETLQEELASRGMEISIARTKASSHLAAAIESILRTMGMPNTGFLVSVTPRRNESGNAVFGPNGCDEVEFLISPNPGSPTRPLARIASGGELSRVALAVKTVLSGLDNVETLIFDEIDTGIGGEAAASVGRHLRELGKTRQVLCITHLASIASMASSHFRVEKEVSGASTLTRIAYLAGKERTAEIARMLAGDQEGETSLAHAAELLRKNSLTASSPVTGRSHG